MPTIHEKLVSFREKQLCILKDDIGPERGVFVSPAEAVSVEILNRMLCHSGGHPFVAISDCRAQAFLLRLMSRTSRNQPERATDSYLQYSSVEAREGVTTGISIADRVLTIRALGAPEPKMRSLIQPGHVFPVAVKEGGVLAKPCLPEAAMDLVKICTFSDAALFIDLLTESGDLMQEPSISTMAEQLSIPVISISEIIHHRLAHESIVQRISSTRLPTTVGGELEAILYRSNLDGGEHLALVKGPLSPQNITTVRVQVENPISDIFGGQELSRKLLRQALSQIALREQGVFIYLRRGLATTPRPSNSASTMREYGLGAQILRDLGVTRINLLSSSGKRLSGLENFGISVVDQEPLQIMQTTQEVFSG